VIRSFQYHFPRKTSWTPTAKDRNPAISRRGDKTGRNGHNRNRIRLRAKIRTDFQRESWRLGRRHPAARYQRVN